MAGLALGRSVTRGLAYAIIASVLTVSIAALLPSMASAASPSVLANQIDVAGFSERAADYASAHYVHRADALDRAEELAVEGQQAEAEREEEERLAALATAAAERARTTTTTAAPVVTTTAPTTTAAPTTAAPGSTSSIPPATTSAPAGGPTAEQWAALRHCESGGRYDAVNPNGRYRGAYQFSQATWDWVASFNNPALIGVDPAAAVPADQDDQALALYEVSGSSPWPTCGAHL